MDSFIGMFSRQLYATGDNSYCVNKYLDNVTNQELICVGPNLPNDKIIYTFTGDLSQSKYGIQLKVKKVLLFYTLENVYDYMCIVIKNALKKRKSATIQVVKQILGQLTVEKCYEMITEDYLIANQIEFLNFSEKKNL